MPGSSGSSGQPPVQRDRLAGGALALVFLAGLTLGILGSRILPDRIQSRPADVAKVEPSEFAQKQAGYSVKPLPVKPVDLNRAERHELLQLPGVGPATAEGILVYRAVHGPFRSIEDLRSVRGIGNAAIERLKPWLVVGEDVEDIPERLTRKPPPPASSGNRTKAPLTEPVELNTCGLEDLERLPGIGPVLAQRIHEERSRKPFTSVDDLKRVAGIGPKRLEQIRPLAFIEP